MLIIVTLFFLFYLLFIYKAGAAYPMLYLMLFVYFIQYVFSVYLIYNVYPVLRRQMPIPQEQLFEYALPALLFLFAGVFIFNKDVNISAYYRKINPERAARLGHLLLFLSFFFDGLSFLGFSSINSITSFTHFLRYAGAMCYLFSPSTLNFALMAIVYLGLAGEALRGGVFIDFMMWMSYLFLMFVQKYNLTFKTRSAFIFLAVPLLLIIQAVKADYRKATWTGKRESGIELFTELAKKKEIVANDQFENSDALISTVGRLNQGWHLGKVLKRVPEIVPFSDGEDFMTDLAGIFSFRIFVPDKKKIGSQEKFQKFAGHRLRGNTSMTIGVLGDFYVNFGRAGSFAALFIFGALAALLFRYFIMKYVLPDPIKIIWVPFLFNYLVRAGNDFYIVMNSFFKGFLIFIAINFLFELIWPDLRPNKES